MTPIRLLASVAALLACNGVLGNALPTHGTVVPVRCYSSATTGEVLLIDAARDTVDGPDRFSVPARRIDLAVDAVVRGAAAVPVEFLSQAQADAFQPVPPRRSPLEEIHLATADDFPAELAAAQAFLARQAWLFGRDAATVRAVASGTAGVTATSPLQLVPTRAERDALGMTHIRFSQLHRGVPVFGAEVIVHLDAAGQVATANGRLVPLDDVSVTPTVTRAQAQNVVWSQAIGEALLELDSQVVAVEFCTYQPAPPNALTPLPHGFVGPPGPGDEDAPTGQDERIQPLDMTPPAWARPGQLCWRVDLALRGPGDEWVGSYLLDADTGAQILRGNRADVLRHVAPAGPAVGSPRLSDVDAVELAKTLFATAYRTIEVQDGPAALMLLAPGLLENNGDTRVHLVWAVRRQEHLARDETHFIDAASAEVRLVLDNVRHLKRRVPDCSAQPYTGNCWSNMLIQQNDPQWGWPANPPSEYLFGCRDEGGLWPCPHGPNPRYLPDEISTDTDDLFVALGDVHEYYWVKFGRNGANGLGGNVDGSYSGFTVDTDGGWSNLDFGVGFACPDAAYFPNQGVYHCKGTVVPDVVGHEYAHGVNYDLVHYGESGALQESHSDAIGEMFEYWMSGTNDWLAGAAATGGPWRSLSDPPSMTDTFTGIGGPYPDRFYSPHFYCGIVNHGGSHHNSTVPSKALYVASVGGRFNGCTVLPIGREAVEQILHRANTLYYAGSESFNGAYLDQIQAATDLYGAGSHEVRQLTRALQAVELDQVGYCADPNQLQYHPPYARNCAGDLTTDDAVDLADVALFQTAFRGPGTLFPEGLGMADCDQDWDVDLDDFALLAGQLGSAPCVP